jgi:hypothetical protein
MLATGEIMLIKPYPQRSQLIGETGEEMLRMLVIHCTYKTQVAQTAVPQEFREVLQRRETTNVPKVVWKVCFGFLSSLVHYNQFLLQIKQK